MATLSYTDKQLLERLFEMVGGYVLNFSDRTFAEFFHYELEGWPSLCLSFIKILKLT